MRKYRDNLRKSILCLICRAAIRGNKPKLKYCTGCLKNERRRNYGVRAKYYKEERLRGRIKHQKNKIKAFQLVSNSKKPFCVKCLIDDIRILTINHIGGIKDKNDRKDTYGKVLSGKIKKEAVEIRCHNCNILYEYERKKYGEWLVKEI